VPARTDGGRRQRRPGRAAGACGVAAGACEPFGDLDGRSPPRPLPIGADCMRGVAASCRPRPFGRGMGWWQQRSRVASARVWRVGWLVRGGGVPSHAAWRTGGRGSDTAPTPAGARAHGHERRPRRSLASDRVAAGGGGASGASHRLPRGRGEHGDKQPCGGGNRGGQRVRRAEASRGGAVRTRLPCSWPCCRGHPHSE